MKPDWVTIALLAAAAYLAWCYLKARQGAPRTFYAAGELDNTYL